MAKNHIKPSWDTDTSYCGRNAESSENDSQDFAQGSREQRGAST